ncbi:MAG: PAS domain S-box protein [Dehalococcoidia bacterium]
MHSLLGRQLKRFVSEQESLTPELRDFLTAVDEAYASFDNDRLLLERSLDLSSRELLEANQEIRDAAKRDLENSEKRLHDLIEHSSDVITILDEAGNFSYNSPSLHTVTGYTPEELAGRSVIEYLHPEDMQRVVEAIAGAAIDPEVPSIMEFRFLHKDGSWRMLESSGRSKIDANGLSIIVNSRDITERKAVEATSREHAELFARAFRASPAAMTIADRATGQYIDANDAFLRLTGFTREEVVGNRPSALGIWARAGDKARFAELLETEGSVSNLETSFRTQAGETAHTIISAEIIEFQGKTCILAIAHDITERKRAEETIEYLAYHDALTSLPNRALFKDRLAVALANGARRGEQVAVMFLDIDRFKVINDTLGHAAGDALLQLIGADLKCVVRDTDTVARIGGDEFTILLPGVEDPRALTASAERILQVARIPRKLFGHEVRPTVSIGVSCYPADGDDALNPHGQR